MENGMVRIHFGGALGRAIGRADWQLYLDKPSPAEAIRAVNVNTKGKLKEYLSTTGSGRFYKIAIARKDNLLDAEEITRPSGGHDIYILPTVRGRNSSLGKILAGIAIIALAFATGGASLIAGSVYAGTIGTLALGLGASLILGGIVQALTPTPSFNQGNGADTQGSNTFGGNAATIAQGGSVGLVYGRALVSPMPISLSLNNFDQAIANTFAPGKYVIHYGAGGVVTYDPIPPDLSENLP